MPVTRRVLVGAGGIAVVAVGGAVAWRMAGQNPVQAQSAPAAPASDAAAAPAPADDPRFAERTLGKADAAVSVTEWFSLTCPHCARFAHDTLPQIQSDLIDPGKLRYIAGDFPLDQVALTAAMVARYLPVDRYWPFCGALLASQDRWAFARNVNSTEEIAKMAALAGMARETFDKAINDAQLRDWILKRQDQAAKIYNIDSTPSFIFSGPAEKNHREAGEQTFESFSKMVAAAAG